MNKLYCNTLTCIESQLVEFGEASVVARTFRSLPNTLVSVTGQERPGGTENSCFFFSAGNIGSLDMLTCTRLF